MAKTPLLSIPYIHQRCGHPAQQHGRRIPPFILETAFSMRIFLVSAFLPDITQQIHSFLAKGVMSSHSAFTFGKDRIAFCKSFGNVCTVPDATIQLL